MARNIARSISDGARRNGKLQAGQIYVVWKDASGSHAFISELDLCHFVCAGDPLSTAIKQPRYTQAFVSTYSTKCRNVVFFVFAQLLTYLVPSSLFPCSHGAFLYDTRLGSQDTNLEWRVGDVPHREAKRATVTFVTRESERRTSRAMISLCVRSETRLKENSRRFGAS